MESVERDANVKVVPSKLELRFYNSKIQDIRALDKIAAAPPGPGDPDLSYRPRTCFGERPCVLEGQRSVLKGSHSSETQHVQYHLDSGRPLPYSDDTDSRRQWFHQEIVDTLRTIGEFRALVVLIPRKGEIRGLVPKMVTCTHTSFDQHNKPREPYLKITGAERWWAGLDPLNFYNLERFVVAQV